MRNLVLNIIIFFTYKLSKFVGNNAILYAAIGTLNTTMICSEISEEKRRLLSVYKAVWTKWYNRFFAFQKYLLNKNRIPRTNFYSNVLLSSFFIPILYVVELFNKASLLLIKLGYFAIQEGYIVKGSGNKVFRFNVSNLKRNSVKRRSNILNQRKKGSNFHKSSSCKKSNITKKRLQELQ